MFSKESYHLFLFLGLAILLGSVLAGVFYLLATYQKGLMNVLAILVIGLLVVRSFLQTRKTRGRFWKKVLFSVPTYFYILAIVLFFLVFLPGWLKTHTLSLGIGTLISGIVLTGFIIRQIIKSKEKKTDHG
jgi:phosphatidylserine synthase